MRASNSAPEARQQRGHEKRGERQKQAGQTLWNIECSRTYGLVLIVGMLTVLATTGAVFALMRSVAAPEAQSK